MLALVLALGFGAPTDPAGKQTWKKHPATNCYWGGHGAEEVEYPWGQPAENA